MKFTVFVFLFFLSETSSGGSGGGGFNRLFQYELGDMVQVHDHVSFKLQLKSSTRKQMEETKGVSF